MILNMQEIQSFCKIVRQILIKEKSKQTKKTISTKEAEQLLKDHHKDHAHAHSHDKESKKPKKTLKTKEKKKTVRKK